MKTQNSSKLSPTMGAKFGKEERKSHDMKERSEIFLMIYHMTGPKMFENCSPPAPVGPLFRPQIL